MKRKAVRVLLLGMGVAVMGVLAAALVLVSGPLMTRYQARIDANPGTGFNRWLQLATADVCRKTWRPEMAAERYRRFMRLYPQDSARPYALLQLARSQEAANRCSDAIRTYQQYIDEYPHREAEVAEARTGIERVRALSGR
ncbi:MAG TPA: tetratricopeptide repeat protein [Planctomycetota bacterium]|nr:tetratricopeptide repeat protein [Planctomycetota bacterium]